MKWYIPFVFCFILITTGCFLCFDHFDSEIKKQFYYLWIKLTDFLLVFGYVFYLKGRLKKVCITISVFYFLRVVWQLFEIKDYEASNQIAIIDILFILCVVTILIVSIPKIFIYAKRLKNGRN